MCLEWEMSHPHPDLALDPFELTGRARTHVVELTSRAACCTGQPCSRSWRWRAPRRRPASTWCRRPASGTSTASSHLERQISRRTAAQRPRRPARGGCFTGRGGARRRHPRLVGAAWASRHHWGTEIDVVDGTRLVPGQPVPLEPAEFAPGGRFASLDRWLNGHMADYGFSSAVRRESRRRAARTLASELCPGGGAGAGRIQPRSCCTTRWPAVA